MMLVVGLALLGIGITTYLVSSSHQIKMDASKATEAKRRPTYLHSKVGEISGSYSRMKAKFANNEKEIKNLRLVSVCSIIAGMAVIGIALLKH